MSTDRNVTCTVGHHSFLKGDILRLHHGRLYEVTAVLSATAFTAQPLTILRRFVLWLKGLWGRV